MHVMINNDTIAILNSSLLHNIFLLFLSLNTLIWTYFIFIVANILSHSHKPRAKHPMLSSIKCFIHWSHWVDWIIELLLHRQPGFCHCCFCCPSHHHSSVSPWTFMAQISIWGDMVIARDQPIASCRDISLSGKSFHLSKSFARTLLKENFAGKRYRLSPIAISLLTALCSKNDHGVIVFVICMFHVWFVVSQLAELRV